jgi:cation diffusion facilitator family transporter
MPADIRKTAMTVSLIAAILMLAGKLAAYFLTGSAAIFSDAAESVIHIAATVVVAISLWHSLTPADKGHPYGHGKVAYFSAGFEGAMIFAAGGAVIYTGLKALIFGGDPQQMGAGAAIIVVMALINLALGLYLIRAGKKTNSLVLVANGKHVMTDMWTSAGVAIGVFLVWLTNILWLDGAVAVAVGANILFTGYSLLRDSYSGLMDAADPKLTQRLVECFREAVERELIVGHHQLRHRQSNDETWIEVHFLVPGRLTTAQAHKNVTSVEAIIRDQFPGQKVWITSHIEPVEHDAAHPDGHPESVDPDPLEAGARKS